jgi:hypothetical protein
LKSPKWEGNIGGCQDVVLDVVVDVVCISPVNSRRFGYGLELSACEFEVQKDQMKWKGASI